VAGKTPHGARPNRETLVVWRKPDGHTNGPFVASPGRLLDPVSNDGARGMVVIRCRPQGRVPGTEFGVL